MVINVCSQYFCNVFQGRLLIQFSPSKIVLTSSNLPIHVDVTSYAPFMNVTLIVNELSNVKSSGISPLMIDVKLLFLPKSITNLHGVVKSVFS
jgi:hypothetical protein